MGTDNTIALASEIADMQENLIVVFKGEEIILTNKSFNTFFGVSSTQEYLKNFGEFVDNFVPHPAYFNAQKIEVGETWFTSILKLPELERIISMMSQTHEPRAFEVAINENITDLKIVTLTDITQTLIKRIMVQNNTNIEKKSGAYAKTYFLHIAKSYEDAANFNEKLIGIMRIDTFKEDPLTREETRELVQTLNTYIRKDDMLVDWGKNNFVLAFLVDDAEKVPFVKEKLSGVLSKYPLPGFSYELSINFQKQKESIAKLINTMG